MNTPPPPKKKYESEFDIDNGTHQGFRPRIYVTKTENWETGTSTGNRKMKTKSRAGNELSDRAEVPVRFFSHPSFLPFPVLVPRSLSLVYSHPSVPCY